MAGQRITYGTDYLVKRTGSPSEARIFASGEAAGELREVDGQSCVLMSGGKERWKLSRRVHGEVRPFSLEVTELGGRRGRVVLTVRNHLFVHHARIYMLTNSPAGRPLREYLLGKRYICRLDGFPTSRLAEVDHESWSRLRTFRGAPVGEMDGLGTVGHHVRLTEELEDIGLPLAAACYLLYSTA